MYCIHDVLYTPRTVYTIHCVHSRNQKGHLRGTVGVWGVAMCLGDNCVPQQQTVTTGQKTQLHGKKLKLHGKKLKLHGKKLKSQGKKHKSQGKKLNCRAKSSITMQLKSLPITATQSQERKSTKCSNTKFAHQDHTLTHTVGHMRKQHSASLQKRVTTMRMYHSFICFWQPLDDSSLILKCCLAECLSGCER